MKLLYCLNCGEVFSLGKQEKTCSCGQSGGKYQKDGLHAEYWGGIPLGINNVSFLSSLFDLTMGFSPKNSMGITFEAFFIPKNCKTFQKIEKNKGK